MATMRAVVFREYGGPEVLGTAERAVPEPGAGQVRVRVVAAGVNPADAWLRSGRFRLFLRGRLPFVPGADVAGVVDGLGPGVTQWAVGDRVAALLPTTAGGGYAPYAVTGAEHLAAVPDGVALTDAAAVPLAGLTALQALRDRAGLRAGADLLVHGASGGVGHLAVQVGTALGARVTAVTSGRNADAVRGLGAVRVVDYEREDPAGLGPVFDVVLDGVAEFGLRRARRVLRPGGVAVTVRPVVGPLARDWLAWTRGGRRFRSVLVRPDGAGLGLLLQWVAEGRVRPLVEHLPLADAAEAHRRIETRRTRGKLVLVVDPEASSSDARRPVDVRHERPTSSPTAQS